MEAPGSCRKCSENSSNARVSDVANILAIARTLLSALRYRESGKAIIGIFLKMMQLLFRHCSTFITNYIWIFTVYKLLYFFAFFLSFDLVYSLCRIGWDLYTPLLTLLPARAWVDSILLFAILHIADKMIPLVCLMEKHPLEKFPFLASHLYDFTLEKRFRPPFLWNFPLHSKLTFLPTVQ